MSKRKRQSSGEREDNSDEDEDEVQAERKKLQLDAKTILRGDNHNEVEMYSTTWGIVGITSCNTIISKVEPKSFEEIRQRVATEDKLNFGTVFYLYPAFKECLLRLLSEIEEVLNDSNSKVRVILVHGVPNMGKSTMAQCLSYCLGLLSGGKDLVRFIRLGHSGYGDSQELTTQLMLHFDAKYVVIDQANLRCLELKYVQSQTQFRYDECNVRMPVVIFTSGHYSPSVEWLETQNTGWLKYKLIDMEVDCDCVKSIMNIVGMNPTELSAQKVLDHTTTYGPMVQCVQYMRAVDSPSDEQIFDRIYPGSDLEKIKGSDKKHFVWLVWQKFLRTGVPPVKDLTDDECSLEPDVAEYLAYLLSDMKDNTDRGMNAVMNMTKIAGEICYENNGYKEFKSDSYKYRILRKKCLHDVLKLAFSVHSGYTEEDGHKMLVSALRVLSIPGQTQYQYVRSGIFEMVIRGCCHMALKKKGREVGMMVFNELDFTNVEKTMYVTSVKELCDTPLKVKDMLRRESVQEEFRIWCVMNGDGKKQFPGFDFAFMVIKTTDNGIYVSSLQLLQATVNSKLKGRDKLLIMSDVLDEIKRTLVSLDLVERHKIDKVVTPYFVQPSSGGGSVPLPFRNSTKRLPVRVVDFPPHVLNL